MARETIAQLKAKLAESQKEAGIAKEAGYELTKRCADLEGSVVRLEQEVKGLERKLGDSQRDLAKTNAYVASLQKDNDIFRARLDEARDAQGRIAAASSGQTSY